MTPDLLERYLGILGVARREPGPDALAEIVRAHVERIPFENVSKLFRLRSSGLVDVPDLEEYLDGVTRLRLGGTCYANNGHLHDLLLALGYRVKLCGADMSRPDVHVVNVVELDGRELLVDAGYGGPFLAPLPLDLDRDHAIALGRDRWVLHPRDEGGGSRLDLLREGRPRHGYRIRPAPRDLAHFRPAIADSFRPGATFMNAIVLARFAPGRSLVLRNLALVEARGDREERLDLADRGELVRAVETAFGVPREVTEVALDAVGDLRDDPWG